jgi:hypothetical protein
VEDVAASGVGEGVKKKVHLLVGRLIYNHVVVD